MVTAISSAASTPFNLATLFSVANASSTSTSSATQEALLEAELAIYTQELAAASSGDASTTPGTFNTQQLQQQIASIEQQLSQLNTTSTARLSIPIGSLINTFA